MILRCLFGQMRESYEEEHAPELLLAWDEYCVDTNPEGFEDECKRVMSALTDYVAYKVIDIEVDGRQIRKLLLDTPKMKGDIK